MYHYVSYHKSRILLCRCVYSKSTITSVGQSGRVNEGQHKSEPWPSQVSCGGAPYECASVMKGYAGDGY